ncbi:ribosomal protein L18e/L15P [Blastocladiella britannica]|nr:ribosomal protein L18e/L15P [Blastocladiella britannica]
MLSSLVSARLPALTSASRGGVLKSLLASSSSFSSSAPRSMILAVTTPRRAAFASLVAAPVTLGGLSDNMGAVKTRRRIGRGNGSGRGGTSGKGHKGQRARAGTGKPRVGFEGGQTTLMKRIPKRGFTNNHGKDLVTVNLDKLQRWIDVGRIDASQVITMKELYDARLVHSVKDGVKLLGDGAAYLRTPVKIEVTQASTSAIKAVEAVGGTVTAVYFNPLGLRALVKPSKFRVLPRRAEPTSTREIDYYASPANRGYLALGTTPTFPAPTATFWRQMGKPIQYASPAMAPIKPTLALIAAREKLAAKAVPKAAVDEALVVAEAEAVPSDTEQQQQ